MGGVSLTESGSFKFIRMLAKQLCHCQAFNGDCVQQHSFIHIVSFVSVQQFDGFKLVGTRYSPPPSPHITKPLRSTNTFAIQVNQRGECYCVCYRGYDGPHLAKLEKVVCVYLNYSVFNRLCSVYVSCQCQCQS